MKLKRLFAGLLAMLAVSANAAVEYTGSAVAKGTFYLYNIGTGKFLNGGDNTAGWSTHGWLTTFGRYAELTANGTGYNINLGYDNSKNRKYLNTDGWCDGDATAWTFTLVDGQENVYYINNGTTYLVGGTDIAGTRGVQLVTGSKDTENDLNNQWKLVTKDNIIAALSQASQENGVDATSLIDCFGFDRNDTRSGSWTKTDAVNVFCGTNGASITKDTKNLGCEAYGKVFSLSQTVKGLPSGKYVLSVQGFGLTSPTYLYCGEEKKQIISTNDTGNMDQQLQFMIAPDKYKNDLPFTYVASDKGMTFGLNRPESAGDAWACWDNFSLTYYGLDLTESQTALTNAVAAAKALYEKNLPTAAKDALKAVVDENNKTYSTADEYIEATANINAAKATATAILSAYDAYNAKKTAVEALKTQNVYTDNNSAATALDAAIAKQDNAVNAATTVEAINTATAALVAAANTFVSSVKINDNAVFDMSNVAITNAEVWRTLDGWVNETNAERGYDPNAKTMEFWRKDGFNLYQSVPVTKGYYRLTVKGFHRINCSPIYAYAGDLATTTFKQEELVSIANATAGSQTTAGAWLDDEANGNNEIVFSTEAGNINIGVKNEFTSTEWGDGKDGWTILRSFKLEYLGESPLSVLKAANDKAKAAANELLDLGNNDYYYVVGTERETLYNLVQEECATSDEYVANTTAINNAMVTFIAAAPSYKAYNEIMHYTKSFNVWVEVAEPTTAAEADDAVLQYKEKTYDAVLEKYALDITDKTIGDMKGWNFKSTKNDVGQQTMKGQHYSGNANTIYYEGNGWGKTGWGFTMSKTVELNPGEYVIKLAARSTANVTGTLTVNDGTRDIASTALASKNDTGYGIDTSGDCNFHPTGTYANNNLGRGWEWGMVRFLVEGEKKTVTFTYSVETDALNAWSSVCDASLLASQIYVPITINEDKTATTIGSEYALDFTDAEGIEAYTVSEINGSYAKLEKVTGAVPANTGLIITGGTPGTYYAKVTQEAATLAGTNYLEAVTTETKYPSDASNTYYVYGALKGVEGFYRADGYTVPAGKAVLKVPVSQYPAKAAIYLNGGATGVAEVEAGADTDSEPIYNVCGQRISKAKGLVIKGGKKYFVK